ncbi:unnamed protein product [Sphenostylis stenocarpa]|uniref:Uncharacterized protein n=1 Tax=Sphenostylis stenocarpa TaxID=92480 RepID=A0AA86VBS3_9FABA|nr:unnamed protein product [Sphenostylis stenocarpa]
MDLYENHSRLQHQRQKKAFGMTFMEFHRWWQVTLLLVSLLLSSRVEGSQTHYEHNSLDSFLRMKANQEIEKPRTGVFYNISPPSNLTGMEVSVVRLRSFYLWSRGTNYSFVNLPPRIMPRPIHKRIAILYENLGNWSSHYYNVPNHRMVAPVFGVMAYSSSKSTFIDEKVNFTIYGDPIKIWFPHVDEHGRNGTPICAVFSDNGLVKLQNMTKPYVCEAHSQGHYTLVIPLFLSPNEPHSQSQGKRFTTWWVLGFVGQNGPEEKRVGPTVCGVVKKEHVNAGTRHFVGSEKGRHWKRKDETTSQPKSTVKIASSRQDQRSSFPSDVFPLMLASHPTRPTHMQCNNHHVYMKNRLRNYFEGFSYTFQQPKQNIHLRLILRKRFEIFYVV